MNPSDIKIFLWNFFGNAENQTRGCWVRSKNATSVLCSPLSSSFIVEYDLNIIQRRWLRSCGVSIAIFSRINPFISPRTARHDNDGDPTFGKITKSKMTFLSLSFDEGSRHVQNPFPQMISGFSASGESGESVGSSVGSSGMDSGQYWRKETKKYSIIQTLFSNHWVVK